jgi:hypothetical protein
MIKKPRDSRDPEKFGPAAVKVNLSLIKFNKGLILLYYFIKHY